VARERAVKLTLVGTERGVQKMFIDSASASKTLSSGIQRATVSLGLYALGARVVGASVGEWRESAKVQAQTAAVLKSTGGAANVTAAHVDSLAGRLSALAGVDDEVIAQGENVLLTFKGVRNEVGAGNNIFDRGIGLALDMSKALGTDLQGATIQVGKALENPVRGITALTRAGVSFTDQQKAQIKALVASGRTLDAQKVILKALEEQFGGTAAAVADPMDKATVAVGNLEEALGKGLAPVITRTADIASTAADRFVAFDDATGGLGSKGVIAAAGLGLVTVGGLKVITMAKNAKVAVDGLNLSLNTLGRAGGPLVAAGVALAVGAENLKRFREEGTHANLTDPATFAVGKLKNAVTGLFGAHKQNKTATDADAKAQTAVGSAAAAAAPKVTAAELATRHAAAAATMYRLALIKQIDKVHDAIPAFEGYTRASDVTAKAVLKNLREEVGGYGTWAKDTQRLLKRGADPKFIAELSTKGPAYVHAMATASDRELATAQKFFRDRTAAMRRLAEAQLAAAGTNAPRNFGRNLAAQGGFVAASARSVAARAESQFRRTADQADDFGRQAGRGFGTGLDDRANLARIGRTSANMARVVSQYLRTKSPSELGPFSQGGGPEGWGRAWMTSYLKGMASQVDSVGTLLADSLGGRVPQGGQVMSIVKSVASRVGWGSGGQWNALAQLISHESGWRPTAQNPTSTAYGLFQFLNSTWAGTGIRKTSDPGLQTVAGLRYIASRYGTPAGAWSFWQRHHWYGQGGIIPEEVFGVGRSGATYSFAERGRIERYVPPGGGGRGGDVHVHLSGPFYVAGDARRFAAELTPLVRAGIREAMRAEGKRPVV